MGDLDADDGELRIFGARIMVFGLAMFALPVGIRRFEVRLGVPPWIPPAARMCREAAIF